VGTSDLRSALLKVPKSGIVVMVAMAMLCRTRIRYTRLVVHLVGGDRAGGVEEGGFIWSPLLWSGGSRSVYVCYKVWC
jgi:hypothetical protein